MKNAMLNRIIILLAVILMFYGCGSSKIQYPEPLITAKEGSFITREGTYKLGEKEYKADYGTITVSENRNKKDSRLIHLPFMRIHARTDNTNEPVFGLAGGPGQSNMQFNPVDTLLYNHDFVMVGYRGVDGSTVLECPEVKEALSHNDDLLCEESLKKIGEAWKASANRFKSSGIDLNGYSMPETVQDIEAVRKAFGYNRINLIGESYGTRLAYMYGVMYPQIINRSIMIGANHPGGFIWDPKRVDEQILYYSNLWAKDSVMSQKCPNLAATMQKVLKNMSRRWFLFSINPGKVKVVTFCLLFERNTAAMVFDSYIAAEKGDYSGLALMSLAFNYVLPDMFVWGEFATKAISADRNYWQENSTEKDNKNSILGAPLNEMTWKTFNNENYPIEIIPDSLRTMVKSEVETLILSGSIDFSTPAEYGKEFLPYLKNGRQVIISEAGHVGDIRYMQGEAIKGLLADYINKGIVDTSEIKYVPMDFNVSWGFPKIAKVSVATVGVLAVILTAGIILLIR